MASTPKRARSDGSHRVLITGVSRFWGAELAHRLESDPAIEQIVAIDSGDPARELARTDFIRADTRHSLVGKLVRSLDIDTVVHAGLIIDTREASNRSVHEANVIGTMNLLAACGGEGSPVRKVVVKTSTAVYGSEPDDPSFWAESMNRTSAPRDSLTRDLDEVESYISDFALRNPAVTVTSLRFANVLGPSHDTPFAAYFGLPVVPTVFGFDPRLQFLHEEDAVSALLHAVRADHPGTFNVAGDGVTLLSQAIALIGRVNAPVLPFIGTQVAMAALRRAGLINFPPHLVRLLQHGRVVDTSRLDDFGWKPDNSTLQTVRGFAEHRRIRRLVDETTAYTYEEDLEAFLRAKGRRDPEPATP